MNYNKLVRDRIPDIIKKQGKKVRIHKASDEEYGKKLNEKLQEELNEFLESSNAEELADIIEVIHAIAKFKNMNMDEIERIRKEKSENKGAFSNQIILEKTED